MYVLVSAIHTLTLCMCMIACTVCINYVYIEPKGYSINAMYCYTIVCAEYAMESTMENMSLCTVVTLTCDIVKPPCILLIHVVFQCFSCRR